MELYYCTICGLRVSDSELQDGNAVVSSERRVLCKKCYSDVRGAKPTPPKPGSARLAVQPPAQAASHAAQSRPHFTPTHTAPRTQQSAPSPSLMWLGIAFAVVLLAVAIGGSRRTTPETAAATPAQPEKTPTKPAETPAVKTTTPVATAPKFTSTFKAVPINTKGNSRGYWEFLPSVYHANPTQQFPIVLYFCNSAESGDGSAAQLEKMRANGPVKILSEASHPLHNLFEERGVVVISLQGPPQPDWWHGVYIQPVVNEVLRNYRVDSRRVYFAGIIAGSLGLHELMDQFPDTARQAAAIWMMCSQGGAGLLGEPKTGPEIASKTPYWAFINAADGHETVRGLDNITAKISGKQVPSALANVLQGRVQTGHFTAAGGWAWKDGIAAPTAANPALTYVNATPPEVFALACNSLEAWNWLLAQQKPR